MLFSDPALAGTILPPPSIVLLAHFHPSDECTVISALPSRLCSIYKFTVCSAYSPTVYLLSPVYPPAPPSCHWKDYAKKDSSPSSSH
jgi:hypothetical protein